MIRPGVPATTTAPPLSRRSSRRASSDSPTAENVGALPSALANRAHSWAAWAASAGSAASRTAAGEAPCGEGAADRPR